MIELIKIFPICLWIYTKKEKGQVIFSKTIDLNLINYSNPQGKPWIEIKILLFDSFSGADYNNNIWKIQFRKIFINF